MTGMRPSKLLVSLLLLWFIPLAALAAQPVITGVSIPNVAMKIDDIVTATISVQSDSATAYTLNASTIGGYALSGLSKQNSTTYTAQFTITKGGTDYASGDTIPTDVTLADGGLTDTWSIAISQANDPIDANRPADPTPTSSSHTVSVWDNDNIVDIQVSGASDPGGSGVDGFEIEWDQSATWIPTESKEQEETWAGDTFTATANGDWYFHIATVDNAGNWTSTEHLGPFQIDTTPPSVPANLSPADGTFTNDTSPTLTWDASTDTGGSGLRDTLAYRYVVDGTPSRSGYTSNLVYTPTLAEGVFVWRIRARDNAGNNSDYAADHTLTIDITDPTDPTPSSSSHTVGVASNDTTVDIDIAGASDPVSNGATSGVDGFETAWDKNATWTATEVKDQEETWTGGTFTATSDGDWYFHIATVDNAGNWTGTEHLGPFDIDTDSPAVTDVSVDTDPMYEGDLTQQVTVTFDEAMDTGTDPTITFGAGTFTSNLDSAWTVGDTVWTETFTLTDNNEEIGVVTVDVTGAKDAAGNDQEPYAEVDEFDIDTVKPMPVEIGMSHWDADFSRYVIREANAGEQFVIDMRYSESLDTNSEPAIVFSPDIVASGTLSFVGYQWSNDVAPNSRVQATYTIVDVNDTRIGVDVTIIGLTDVAGNPVSDDGTTHTDAIDVDTQGPTLATLVVTDTLLTDADDTSIFEVDVTFSEDIKQFDDLEAGDPLPSIAFSADVLASGTLTQLDVGWNGGTTDEIGGTYTVDDVDETQIGVDIIVDGVLDIYSNPLDPSPTTSVDEFDVDTKNPTVTSVFYLDSTSSYTVTTDADTNDGANAAAAYVQFSEPMTMDGSADPTFTFSPNVDSTLPPGTAFTQWNSSTEFLWGTLEVDVNVDVNSVTIDVDGARDEHGNLMVAYTPVHEFEIDTVNPTVTNVSVDDVLITDADDGGTFTVTVDFSEAMTTNGSADPAIIFAPLIGTTLAFTSENWPDSDTYTATYDVSDGNVDHDSVTIDVTGAKDANGNDQQDYTPEHEFEVDTLNPTITSITSTTPDGYYNFGNSINVTVSFSEPVTLTGGTLDVTLDTPGDVVSLAAFGPATSSFTAYTIGAGDNSCDLDAIGVVLNGGTLRDNAGNDAVIALPATTIADGSDITVDTTDPVISGLDLPDTEQSVDANCSITIPYSAVVTDNCCVNAVDVTVVVEFVSGAGTAILTAPPPTITNNGIDQVDVIGSFTVSDLTAGDVVIRVRINAIDCAGNAAAETSDTVTIGDSTVPVISGLDLPDTEQSVDANCTITIPYSAVVTDNCCLVAGSVNVTVEFVDPFNTATLTAPPALIVNSGGGSPNDMVSVSGSFTVSNLTGSPVQVQVRINGTDCNGNAATQASDTVVIIDSTIPVIVWDIELPPSPQYVDPMTCIIAIPIRATVTDNCCILAGNVSVDISVTNVTVVHGVTVVQAGDDVLVFGDIIVFNLTGCPAVLSVAIDATDCCGNDAAQLTDLVEIYDNTIPVINDLVVDDHVVVDDCCETTVNFTANVTDNCCITPGGITITPTNPTNNLTIDFDQARDVTITQNGQGRVDITGVVPVRCLTSCPARVEVHIEATDCCGNDATQVSDTGGMNDSTIPVTSGLTVSDEMVGANCEATVTFSATVTDNCCVTPGGVAVNVTLPTGNATLGTPTINKVQNGQGQVDITGSVLVSDLTGCPATVEVTIDATDCCGNDASQVSGTGGVTDTSIPVIGGLTVSDEMVDGNCEATVTFLATVTDNCCVTPGGVAVNVTLPTGNATLGTPTINKVQNGQGQVDVTGSVLVSGLSGCPATVEVTIDAIDCCTNIAVQETSTGDVNDSTVPAIVWDTELPGSPQYVSSDTCTITLPIQATVTDNCCILAKNVDVDISVTNATIAYDMTVLQVGDDVLVSGDITVSALTGCPAVLSVTIDADDCCGNDAVQLTDSVEIYDNTIPVIVWDTELPDGPEVVSSDTCTITLPILATVTDNCCILAGNVNVDISVTNATLAHDVTVVQVGGDVLVSGDITISKLTGCPAVLSVTIDADDCCGNDAVQLTDTVNIIDTTIPVVNGLTVSDETVDANCEATVTFSATVMDNCCTTPGEVTVVVTLSTANATLGAPLINKVQNGQGQVDVTGSVLVSGLTGCPATVEVTIDATDCCGNDATQVSDTGDVTDTLIPVINDLVVDDHVLVSTDCCEATVNFTANVTDNCCIVPDNVAVTITLPTGNAVLENIVVSRVQNGQGQVDITGSADVRCLTSCPARVELHIEATDCCGNDVIPVTSTTTEGRVYDEMAPEPKDDRFRLVVRGGDAPFQLDVMQNDTDNCSSCTCCGTMWIHDIVAPPVHGTATIEVDHGDCNGGSSIRYAQYPGYCGTDEFTYRIVDACGNVSLTATVLIDLIAETVMDDIYLTTCANNSISFGIGATDPRINPINPDEILFVFSIVTPPLHGVVSGDLGDVTYAAHGGIESATITLIYTPAAGFTGGDALTLRFADPFGGSSTAVVDIAVIECAGQSGAPPLFVVQQGEIFPLIVPLTFAVVYEKEWHTVTVQAIDATGTLYNEALSATWEESINRYVLRLDTASLPPGLYQVTIPLGNGETVTLMIEVGEAV